LDEPWTDGSSIGQSVKGGLNRALVLAALARGTSTLHGALFSDDTRHMARALADLGIRVTAAEKRANAFALGQGRSSSRPARPAVPSAAKLGVVGPTRCKWQATRCRRARASYSPPLGAHVSTRSIRPYVPWTLSHVS
jgi:hypothetical protein